MDEKSLLEFRNRNSNTSRLAWIMFFFGIVLCCIYAVITLYNIEKNKQGVFLVNELNGYSKRINDIGFELNRVLENNGEVTESKRNEFSTELAHLDQFYSKIKLSIDGLFITNPVEIIQLQKDLKRNHANFINISELIAEGNKGVDENKVVFKTQLNALLHSYEIALADLRIVVNNEAQNSALEGLYLNFYLVFILLFLAIIVFFGILKPIKKSFTTSEAQFNAYNSELIERNKKEQDLLKAKNDIELKLKTKNAQVFKLQDSVEESITQIEALRRDKSLIYLNAASDLEGYLKVVKLQKEIIENQTNISQNSSWTPLSSAIAQLNSMVGDYFNRAKGGFKSELQSEVYLSQLISEIILSTSIADESIFEQVEDMPSIKTNVVLLKNVISPYFELVNTVKDKNIKVSAYESGAICEIKLIGLSDSFLNALVEISKKDLVNMNFLEFKIHMAKNLIVERGGAVWVQDDAENKGVICLRWTL
ncbi:MAG: hypothetical protein ACPGVC_06135 [Salibacteraceae bacterium]